MAKHRVVIEISPSRLEVAIARGEGVARRSVQRISMPAAADQWPGCLSKFGDNLKSMVEELGARGAEATILYTSPTTVASIFNCPRAAGASEAEKAARLALAEALGRSLHADPHDLTPLATDRDPGKASPTIQAQNHTLGVADADASAQAVADWARSAGLRPVRQLPRDMVALVAAIDRALESSEDGHVSVALYTGEHESVLVAAAAGRLCFVRQLAVGVETFVDALAGRMTAPPAGGAAADPAAYASETLFKIGIPTRDQATTDGPQSPAGIALPLFQPILQRFIVDLKQSLRFGLEELERSSAKLIGMGPGSRIPRLLEVIAEQTGLKHTPEAAGADGGAISDFVALRPLSVNLLPRALHVELGNRRLIRGMWVGVAAALVLIGAGSVMTRAELGQEKDQVQKLKGRLEAVKPATDLAAKLAAAQAGISGAQQRIASRLGNGEEWDAVLAMLASSTPANIRLTEAQFGITQGKPTCRLVGYAAFGTQVAANNALQDYLNSLVAVPIVRSCRQGATQWIETNTGHRENFEANLTLVELPSQPQTAARIMTSVTTEESR